MIKTLRIFAKDVRHLWPEILLSLAITAAFAGTCVHNYRSVWADFSDRPMQVLATIMAVLMPLSWWLLVARVVHDEPLVGDRQFWTTRPYGWYRVLAAKVLFIVAFIALPVFTMRLLLLHSAGLYVRPNIALTALQVAALSITVLLPLLVLAAVTRSLVQMLLTLIACAIYIGLCAWIDSVLPAVHSYGPDPRYEYPIIFGVAAILLFVLVLQYAERATAIARWILIGTTVAVTILAITLEHAWTPHTVYAEPSPGESKPLSVTFENGRSRQPQSDAPVAPPSPLNPQTVPPPSDGTTIYVPLYLSGIAPGHAVRVDHVVLRFETPSVLHSPFFRSESFDTTSTFLPAGTHDALRINLGSMFDDMRNDPLTLHVTLAITELEDAGSSIVDISATSFHVPDGGLCYSGQVVTRTQSNVCLYPAGQPPLTFVHDCITANGSPSPASDQAVAWFGSDDSMRGFDINFDPVTRRGSDLSGLRDDQGNQQPCTRATFTHFRAIRHRLLHFRLPPILPRDYTTAIDTSLTPKSSMD